MGIEPKKHLKNIIRIPPSISERQKYMRFDLNESVDGLPRGFVKKALSKITPNDLATYPETQGLSKIIAKSLSLNSKNIHITNGSDGAIKQIFDAYISPGDKILLTNPTFAMYHVYSNIFQAQCISIDYNPDLSFPMQRFLEAINSSIKMAVLVNPNNPTGSVLNVKEMRAIVKKTKKYNILTLIDEAYFYYYDQSIIKDIKANDHLIIIRTFSKLCALANVRLGYAAAQSQLLLNLKKVSPTFDVNGIAVTLGSAFLSSGKLIPSLVNSVQKGKSYLVKRLGSEGFVCREGHANFVLIQCGDIAAEMIKELRSVGILVHGGFPQSFLKGYVRVTCGSLKSMRLFAAQFLKVWRRVHG